MRIRTLMQGLLEYFQLVGLGVSAEARSDHNKQPVRIRDEKIKWLDFAGTPGSVGASPALVSHPGRFG